MFKDNSGKWSLVRVMSGSCLLVALGLPIAAFIDMRPLSDMEGTIFALLGCAFGGKVWQKGIEAKGK